MKENGKKQYRVKNWREYNKSLKARGSLGVWLEKDMIDQWNEPKVVGKNGRPKEYSDQAIICALTIRLVLKLPLRATEGFLESLFKMAGIEKGVPDYTLMCKRQTGLDLPKLETKNNKDKKVTDIVIDSTGVKVYGEGEWKVRTHGASKRRTWRKIHIGIDPETGEIIAEKMTENDHGDPEELPGLLDQVEATIDRVIADGAYDTKECYEAIAKKGGKAIIPPRKNACLWPESGPDHARNQAVIEIEKKGSKQWKENIGYHKRSIVESTMYRLKTILSGNFKSRLTNNQKLESRLFCNILNKCIGLGKPLSIAI